MRAPVPAMFDDASEVRRVHREGVLLLGGGRALLMQVAHPSVAAGVAEHSDFASRRLARLARTLRPTYALVFGTPEQAEAAAARIAGVHRGVVGPGYRASDPDLLLWVHATLVDTALLVFERFVRPLTPQARERYYGDMCRVGGLLGIPAARMPADLAAFRRYVDAATGDLEVTDAARGIARELFRPTLAMPAAPLMREVTAGLLPPALRRQYGLGWDPARAAALVALERTSRAVLPLVPPRMRRPPAIFMPPRR